MKKKLYIFDLDGTLVDAYKAIEKSVNFTREKLGYALVGFQTVKRNIGHGDKLFIGHFFPKRDGEKALKIYRSHHRKSLLRYVILKPYAKKLLYRLKKRKKIVAIASNRPRPFTNVVLRKAPIKKYLDYILCGDEIDSLKPNPKIIHTILKRFGAKKEEAVYIGDMDVDLATAQRAGVDAIFVKGGSSPLKDVKKFKNKKVVSSLEQILDLYE